MSSARYCRAMTITMPPTAATMCSPSSTSRLPSRDNCASRALTSTRTWPTPSQPITIYGRIVAEADRVIVPETIVRRTIQYGLDHYPTLDREQHYERTVQHLREKYGEGGYLRLWFDDSPNAARLTRLRQLIASPAQLRPLFDRLFAELK